jgi:hypothetical protein
MIVVDLHDESFGLVVPRETGVVYKHQSGGTMCTESSLEGYFVPLPPMILALPGSESAGRLRPNLLMEFFAPRPKPFSECAAEVNRVLALGGNLVPMQVDEARSHDSLEGWFWLRHTGAPSPLTAKVYTMGTDLSYEELAWPFRGEQGLSCVLVWPNSD